MRFRFPSVLFLAAILLAGCAAADPIPQPDQSPPPDRSAVRAEPAADKPPVLVDDPGSPYPMAVESWTVDMDGDGVDELVELRAEKVYWGSETEPDQWLEQLDSAMHPYTLAVTRGETVYELPLGFREENNPLWSMQYWDGNETSRYWTRDRSGNPVLAMWFDTISNGGMGNIDVYAAAFLNGEPVLLPVPCYGIQAELDQETMTAQVTVPETGYTETLDLMQWLADYEKRNREYGHDFTFEPLYSEDGALEWPVAPGNIDGFYAADQAEEGITLRQYLWGSAHADGMGALVTAMSWENGKAVVLDQYFDWVL